MKAWRHKNCGGMIQDDLWYSDADHDYHFPVCETCQSQVNPRDAEFVEDPNGPLRMYIALKILRAWNNGTAGFHAGVVAAINAWIDGGMRGPVPWPESPFFAQWAQENGYSKIDDKHVGFRFTATLAAEGG